MTVIAGFNCVDGVVMAADTEESFGESGDKAYCHKLFPVERQTSRLCVAGSGLAYLIDYANEQIVSAFQSGITNVADFQSALSGTLQKLYKSEFKHYPVRSREDSTVQLLVGVQFKDGEVWTSPVLFECHSNLVVPVQRTKQASILGAGELLKQTAIQFSGWGLDVRLGELVSLHLIQQAKRRFGGVGGKTHVFTMRTDGTFSYDRGYASKEKDVILENLDRTCQLLVLSLSTSLTDTQAKDLVDSARDWLSNARKHLIKAERNRGKAKHESIELRNTPMRNMMKRIHASKRSASQKSEPEP